MKIGFIHIDHAQKSRLFNYDKNIHSILNFSVQLATEYWNEDDHLEIESLLNSEFDVEKKQYAGCLDRR